MAGTTRYAMAKELIDNLRKQYDVISIGTLRAYIMKELASDEKTILVYLQVMRDTGLIKDSETGWILNDKEHTLDKNIPEGSGQGEENCQRGEG